MGYMHISNLYADQNVLRFKQLYALEKLHGTSANVQWRDGHVRFSSGGEKHERFAALFNEADLAERFTALGHDTVVVYGEAYGGSQQKQAWRYGPDLKFAAFEVKIGDTWLNVANAHDVSTKLGLEFVHYVIVPTELAAIDAERDAPSEQARRNGVEGDQPREGVVLRPLDEMFKSNGERIIAKHKRDEERETKTPRKVVDPAEFEKITSAAKIADEYVTDTRLVHVLQKLELNGETLKIDRTGDVARAMVEDVTREAAGEILDSKEARSAIGRKARELFHAKLSAESVARMKEAAG